MIFRIYEYEFQGVEEWTSWWFQKILLLLLNLIQDSGINHQPILRPPLKDLRFQNDPFPTAKMLWISMKSLKKLNRGRLFQKPTMEKSQQVENQV